MRLNLAMAAEWLGLEPPAGDTNLTGAAIDSREVRKGDLFVCLPGERVDGHDFASDAASAGAAAILAQKPVANVKAPVLRVENTEKAFGDLARKWREQAKSKVICLTGTAGKTTLKDTLAAILSRGGNVAFTRGNHNNQIGLPLTILNAPANADFWLLEAGISRAGDMDYLGAIARPDLAIILNVGPGHTEGLGDKGAAWHKTRLLTWLADGGDALINGDYADLLAETSALGMAFSCFGKSNHSCAFRVLEQDGGNFLFDLAGKKEKFATPFRAEFGWEVALASAAAAALAGLSPQLIQDGFANARLPGGRFCRLSAGPYLIIDDSYNANPLSMERALAAAATEAARLNLPFAAVLGEMRELGDEAAKAHCDLGRALAGLNPAAVFWKGPWLEEISQSAAKARASKNPPRIIPTQTPQDFISAWQGLENFPPAALILFKGSRKNRLEEFIKAFQQFQAAREGARVL